MLLHDRWSLYVKSNQKRPRLPRRDIPILYSNPLSYDTRYPFMPTTKQPQEQWLEGLEDVYCKEKDESAKMSCKYSKCSVQVRWLKNKLEIFQGKKYNFSKTEDGVFTLTVQNIGMEDAGRYACQAEEKTTNAKLFVEGECTFQVNAFIHYLVFKLKLISGIWWWNHLDFFCSSYSYSWDHL